MNIRKKSDKRKKLDGFTLIELMISMGIFSMLIVIIMSTLVLILQTSLTVSQRQHIQTSLQAMLEQIKSNAQFGYNFAYCSGINDGSCITYNVNTLYYSSPSSTQAQQYTVKLQLTGGHLVETALSSSGSPLVYNLNPSDVTISALTQTGGGSAPIFNLIDNNVAINLAGSLTGSTSNFSINESEIIKTGGENI